MKSEDIKNIYLLSTVKLYIIILLRSVFILSHFEDFEHLFFQNLRKPSVYLIKMVMAQSQPRNWELWWDHWVRIQLKQSYKTWLMK